MCVYVWEEGEDIALLEHTRGGRKFLGGDSFARVICLGLDRAEKGPVERERETPDETNMGLAAPGTPGDSSDGLRPPATIVWWSFPPSFIQRQSITEEEDDEDEMKKSLREIEKVYDGEGGEEKPSWSYKDSQFLDFVDMNDLIDSPQLGRKRLGSSRPLQAFLVALEDARANKIPLLLGLSWRICLFFRGGK